MILFKACPRCRGDLHVSGDIYGDYRQCIQCGYMADVVRAPAAASARRVAHRRAVSKAAKAA